MVSLPFTKKTKHKRKVALLKVEPINFRIKPEEEKQAIIKGFQGFLNSLESPIMIVMSTDNINLDVYLKELEVRVEKLNKPFYDKIFESYNKHLGEIINSTNVMNRSFYIAIPETTNLSVQVQVIKEKLTDIGLKNNQLSQEEVIFVLSRFFNDLSLEDDDKSSYAFSKLTPKNLTQYSIQPKYVKNYPDYIRVNNKLNRIIYASGYPRSVEPGFLDGIITANGEFDLAIHIEPFPTDTMMVNLNRELNKQRADLWAAKEKGILNQSLEIQYADTKAVLEIIQKGTQKLFNVSLYINCRAKTKQELELLTSKVQSELNSSLIQPKIPRFRMGQGLQSILPICRNELGIKRNVTTSALSAFFPFTSTFLQADSKGIWYGVNKTGIPIIKDIFALTNPNGMILASSGAGKSYTAKLLIARHILNGTKVMVIDPQDEYAELTKTFRGQLITISKEGDTIINPLDLMGHEYGEKRLTLIDVFNTMLGDVSEIQKAVLDKSLTRTYQKAGIFAENKESWKNTPPILGDLLEELEEMSKTATKIESETYRSLINRLSMYVHGVFSFFNKQTKLDFTKRFVTFNIGDMPKQCKPVIMFLILDYVYMKMKKDKERKVLFIDEAWSLLARAEEAGYIFEIVKTCRKFNMGLLLITQDVADLVSSQAGNALLANSSYTILLRQKPAVIQNVVKTFHLSNLEKDRLLTAGPGEGILICENDHSELKVLSSPEEHKVITTNPDELLKMDAEKNKSAKKEEKNAEKTKSAKDKKKEEEKLKKEEAKRKELAKLEKQLKKNRKQYLTIKKEKKARPKDLKRVSKKISELREGIKKKKPIKVKTQPALPTQKGIDVNKGYFRKKELTNEQLGVLFNHDYEVSMHVPLGGGQPEEFLLKPVHRSETKEHFFLVKAVEEYLEQFTDTVTLAASREADIMFTASGKPWAFEIETGTVYENPKKFHAKIEYLKKTYKSNFLFIVTRSRLAYKYAKYAPTFTRKTVCKRIRLIFKEANTRRNPAEENISKNEENASSSPTIKSEKKPISPRFRRRKAQNKPKTAKKLNFTQAKKGRKPTNKDTKRTVDRHKHGGKLK